MEHNEISTNKMRSEKFPINGFNNLFITLNYIASIGTLFPKAAVAAVSAHTRFSCCFFYFIFYFHSVDFSRFFFFCSFEYTLQQRDALPSDYNRNGCECVPGHLCTSSFMLVDKNKKQIHGMFGERDGSQNI